MSETTEQPETGQESGSQEAAAQQPTTDWEAEARKWEKRSKDNYAKLKDAEPKLAEYEQMKAASQTEAERQAAELSRWQSEAETWRQAAVGNRVQALASVDFADASDAVAALSGKNYLDAGGQIDEEQIKADLTELLEHKPHWRRAAADQPPVPRLPVPNRAQGAGGQPSSSDPASQFATFLQSQLQNRG